MNVPRSTALTLAAWIVVAAPLAAPRAGGYDGLPPEAAAAVQALFPDATLVAIGQEREYGVFYYEVALRTGEATIELEVTTDGVVGEVETEVALADVPPPAQAEIARLTGGGPVGHVERHEVRGVPRGSTFAPVDPPVVFYEVTYERDGIRREVSVASDGGARPVEPSEDIHSTDANSNDAASGADLDDDD